MIVAGLARQAMVLVALLTFLQAIYFHVYSQRKMNLEPQSREEFQ